MLESSMVPAIKYDPTAVFHHLVFKCRCHEAHSMEFQRFFEEIMVRVQPEFTRIKPHGNAGDRKTDGLYSADGTVYQVYAPYEIELPKLKKKVEEDLDGAVEYWSSDLKKWVFVYNAPRGAPADVFKVLSDKQKQYPTIVIDSLSNDQLWEMVRGLPPQQRVEILGPSPFPYADAFVTPAQGNNFTDIDNPWVLIIHDPLSPVNIKSATEALLPNKPFGAPFYIRSAEFLNWTAAADYQREKWEELRKVTWDLSPQYALFSIAPIPLAVHLGFLLSDRIDLTCFHYHRDGRTWTWPDSGIPDGLELELRNNVPNRIDAATDVALAVSLSAPVLPSQRDGVIEPDIPLFEVTTGNPDVFWLRSPDQLRDLGRRFLETLNRLRSKVPNCQRIHLFYAGPSAGAVVIGQRINPRMIPPVELYHFSTQMMPQYQHALTLSDTGDY